MSKETSLDNTQATETGERISMGLQIGVFDNGFVFVGQVFLVNDESGQWVEFINGYNVRSYGTTNGLSQLAASGPLPETKLDKIEGLLKCVRGRLNFFMECNKEQWQKLYPI